MADKNQKKAGNTSPGKKKSKSKKSPDNNSNNEATGPQLQEKQQGTVEKLRGVSGRYALQWKNINFKVLAQKRDGILNNLTRWFSDEDPIKEDQHILKDSCGYVKQGELVAIIGPSGGGKTTLLNVLARRYNMLSHSEFAMNGSITLNNKDLSRQLIMDYGAFLEQDDLLCETSTPRELINESSIMRTNVSHAEAKLRTDKLLRLLNLEENADKIVGGLFTFSGISAKERKRTALAVELITDPQLIFLDEPTSGLDSENAYTMISMLKRETQVRGAAVLCTLH